MSVAFASRNPTPQEVERLRLVLSTFRDGSGMIAAGDETFPGWRDFERAVAAVLGGSAPEAKGVFDVIVPSTNLPATDYGLSIKSKKLGLQGGLANLSSAGRVYMELSNSPAKFLACLKAISFTEANFTAKKRPKEVGEVVLSIVTGWHDDSVRLHREVYGRALDLSNSRYLVLSYHHGSSKVPRCEYQWHAFDLAFPPNIVWKYTSSRCLRGFDPSYPEETLFDFYLLSGGQLKYYPRASTARFSSEVFELAEPKRISALARASRMYPAAWLAAGGVSDLTSEQVIQEVESMIRLTSNLEMGTILKDALQKLKNLGPQF